MRQPGLTRAWKTGPATPAATVSTKSLAQAGSAAPFPRGAGLVAEAGTRGLAWALRQ